MAAGFTRDELRRLEIMVEMGALSSADVAQWFGDGFSISRPRNERQEVPETKAQHFRRWYRKVGAAWWREWRKRNPESARAAVRRYREADRERARRQSRESYARHIEKRRAEALARYHAKKTKEAA